MDQVIQEVENNDLFRGGALLTILGSIAYYLKEVPIKIAVRIDRLARFKTTIDETSSGRLYEAFALWYALNYPGKLRNTVAAFESDTKHRNIEDKKRKFKTRYTHKADVTWIWNRIFPMVISKERNKMEHASYTSERYEEVYMISAFFGKKRIMRMIEEVKEWYEGYLEERQEDIYVNLGRHNGGKYITSYKGFDKIYHQCAEVIKQDIDEYERRKDFYNAMGIRNKRSYLFWGPPGCHAADTEILMFDGSIKKVQDVCVGDMLMGPDSEPRTVLELRRGVEKMVKITPVKGEPFVVNNSHILHLTPSGESTIQGPINMPFYQYAEQTQPFQDRFKLTRTGVNFSNTPELKIPPYILGLWLGDGTANNTSLTTIDQEIEDIWVDYGKSIGLTATIHYSRNNTRVRTITLVSPRGQSNHLRDLLREYKLFENKHVPQEYMTASRDDRLQLLAGLIDTDGHVEGGGKRMYGSGIDIVQKRKQISDAIVFVARSLGYAAYQKECTKGYTLNKKYGRFEGTYYRVSISGDLTDIPCILERKKAVPRGQIKDVLRTGFTYEYLPEDNYYGFTLNKDHLYLTSDFTIHHNTGKTSLALAIAGYTKRDVHILNLASLTGDEALNNFIADVPPRSLILLEDVHTWFEKKEQTVSLSGLLNVLDGILSPDDVIIVATANRLEAIDSAFLRTGRMDVTMEIGPASPEWVSKFVSNFYGVKVEINKSLTISDVQEACLRTKDVLSLSL